MLWARLAELRHRAVLGYARIVSANIALILALHLPCASVDNASGCTNPESSPVKITTHTYFRGDLLRLQDTSTISLNSSRARNTPYN